MNDNMDLERSVAASRLVSLSNALAGVPGVALLVVAAGISQ